MKNSTKFLTMALMLLFAVNAAFISGCASKGTDTKQGAQQTTKQQESQEQSNKQKEPDVIKIPDIYTLASIYLPYIAEERGYFKEEGIKPVFTGVIGPAQHLPAVVSGTNDVGGMLLDRTISGIAAGAKVKAVVDNPGSTKENPLIEFVVLEDSPIKQPSDLLGKKIGVLALGGPHENTPLEWLKKNGISNPKGKVEFVVVPGGTEEQALRSKQVDVMGFIPHPSVAFSHGGLRTLFSDYDVWGNIGQAAPWYFTDNFIKEKPDVVKRFVKAIIKAGVWTNDNRQQAAEIIAKRQKLDVAKVNPLGYFEPTGLIKEESVKLWINILKENGTLKTDINPKDIYTNEFNENFKK